VSVAGRRVAAPPVELIGRVQQLSVQRAKLDEFEADVFLLLFEIGNGLGKFRQLDEHSFEKIGHDGH
jgi:hypothetical protein